MSEEILLLIFGILLFGVGLYAMLGKRNAIKILMGLEIMTVAVNVVLIAIGTSLETSNASPLSRIFPIISLAIGAAVMGLGLAIVINNYMHTRSVDTDKMATLKR